MPIPKLRWLVALGTMLLGLAAYPAFASAAAPKTVPAYYMYGTTVTGLVNNAAADGCDFASSQPDNQTDIMLLDFGAPRVLADGTFGAIDFSNTLFSNANILAALKAAADGYHACHVRGAVIIEYGNSNWHMSNVGMTNADAWNAGYDQETQAMNLSVYQDAHGYTSQGSGAASDIEPSYDGPLISKQLVNGASARDFSVYDDFGSVDGCPTSGSSGSCNNGWDVGDVAYVSFHGLAVPLPEIYYTVSANQWTVVRKWWNANTSSSYFFDGITGTTPAPSGGVSATAGWSALTSRNPGLVGDNIVCYGSGC